MGARTIGIIGCGNMGSAIARGIAKQGSMPLKNVFLYDKEALKLENVLADTGCSRGELSQMVRGSDILIIAVKPQDSEQLLSDISSDITDQVIVSIMAGVKILHIECKLGKEIAVARAMPNMGAVVGQGMTCISFNDLIREKDIIKDIFRGSGDVLEVPENLMDAITAVSGSGPAYLFYLADAMMEAAVEEGLDSEDAREMVSQTLYGAACILKASTDAPKDLIDRVASKGGTTEAALSVFSAGDMSGIIRSAIKKAKERSQDLERG